MTAFRALSSFLLAGSMLVAPHLLQAQPPSTTSENSAGGPGWTHAPDLPSQPHHTPGVLTLYVENDGAMIGISGNDRHYTSGQGIGFAHRPAWADGLAEALRLPADATAAGYLLKYQLYTPEEIMAATPDPDDWPYAAHLSGGVYWQRTWGRQFEHVQLDLGLIGPSALGESVQKRVHKIVGSDTPNGWDNQLADDLTYQLHYRRHLKLPLSRTTGPDVWQWDLIPEAGFNLGNVHRDATVGALLRYGWNIPSDFGPGRLAAPGAATWLPTSGQAPPQDGFTTSFFGRAAVRYVQYNKFIDDSKHVAPPGHGGIRSEDWVGEFQLGATVGYRGPQWTFDAGYTLTFLTHEYEGQPSSDNFGAWVLNLQVLF